MKTIFRFLSLGLVSTAIAGAGATASYAQDACADVDGQTALYTKYTELYPKTTLSDRKAAIEAGKQFLEKYGSCEAVKEQSDYLKAAVPKLEELVAKQGEADALGSMFKRFDAAINTDNADEIYAAGKEILVKQPDNLNIQVPLGVVGLYQSYNKNNKYADDTIRYAQAALNDLKAGKPCKKKNKAGAEVCGALKYEFPRADAINELTYSIAYLNFYAKNDKKTALPIFYELTQSSGKYKDEPRVYATIGGYYLEQAAPLGEEIAKLIALQKGTDTDEVKLAREAEIKGKVALFNGYTERALDAFGRAHKVAKSDTPAAKTYKDELYKNLQTLYVRRFEKKDGMDTYIASVVAKPMPNPTSAVTPIADPEPVKPTTTTGAPTTASPAAVVTKPVSSAAPKMNVSEAVKTPAAAATAVKTKSAAKKPAARKKGTR